jgi:hypothetical protein
VWQGGQPRVTCQRAEEVTGCLMVAKCALPVVDIELNFAWLLQAWGLHGRAELEGSAAVQGLPLWFHLA